VLALLRMPSAACVSLAARCRASDALRTCSILPATDLWFRRANDAQDPKVQASWQQIESTASLSRSAQPHAQPVQVSTSMVQIVCFAPPADFPALSSSGIKARAASTDPVATFS
jgi:hypothetical protein